LHPSLLKPTGVSGKVYVFELRLDAISKAQVPQAKPVSKFPEVQRDLAFVVTEDLPMRALLDAIHLVKSDLLKGIEVFDIYRGQGVDDGYKSVALTLKIQHQERTLQDEEVDTLVSQVIEMAKENAQAELRQ
jgi:phenylalanyl-tRNA synthetase beta chain